MQMVAIFTALGEQAEVIDARNNDKLATLLQTLDRSEPTQLKPPLAFVKGDFAGGLADLQTFNQSGALKEWLQPHQYDLVVVGGGSGGLAAAKVAATLRVSFIAWPSTRRSYRKRPRMAKRWLASTSSSQPR